MALRRRFAVAAGKDAACHAVSAFRAVTGCAILGVLRASALCRARSPVHGAHSSFLPRHQGKDPPMDTSLSAIFDFYVFPTGRRIFALSRVAKRAKAAGFTEL